MKVSLKKKVSISATIIIVVFTIISAIALHENTQNLFFYNIQKDIGLIAQAQSRETTRVFQEGYGVVEALSKHSLIREYLMREDNELQNQEVLHELKSFNIKDHYSALYLLNDEGRTLVSTDDEFVGKNYKFREQYKKGLQGEKWMDASFDIVDKEIGYFFSSPVKGSEGEVIGVLIAQMRPRAVHNSLRQFDGGSLTTFMLVDKYGVILFSTDESKSLHSLGKMRDVIRREIISKRRFDDLEIQPLGYDSVQENLSSTTGVHVLRLNDDHDESKKIVSIAKVGQFPFHIVSEQHELTYSRQILKLTFLLVLIFMGGGLASVVAIGMILRHVFMPLDRLKEVVHHIIDGDYTHKVNIKTGDELEEFAVGFNKMIATLKRTKKNIDKKILSQTKGLLDQKRDLELKQVVMKGLVHEMEVEREKNRGLVKDLQKFLLAIENVSDHIVITDPDGIIIYANPTVEKMTGYKVSEVIGQKAGTINNWGGKMDTKFYKKLWDTLKVKKKPVTCEVTNIKRNGTPYDVSAHFSPVLDDKGEVIFLLGVERDITKEKQIDKAKTEFVSLASHQLRTPLSSINWYTEMLLAGDAGKLNAEQKEYLGMIYEGNQRMVALVNSLLNVSRVDLGTFAIEPEAVSLSQMADSVIGELVPDTTEKKLEIIKQYSPKLPDYKCDSKLMRIIFQNLLTNAVKYTPEKGSITVTIKKSGTKNLLIEVKDTGYGIPEEQHSKIFTKLFRADNVRARDSEGNGLGLYLVKAIVEESKGKISFKSKENKGTTFSIVLPLSGMKKKEGARTIS